MALLQCDSAVMLQCDSVVMLQCDSQCGSVGSVAESVWQ